jgi:V/A-type H+-transporting ATPase subunit K
MVISGSSLAVFGAFIAAFVAGIGSVIGVGKSGIVAAGILSEKPELFGKLLPLQLLPGTQGIYGFLVAFLIWFRFVGQDINMITGMLVIIAALPVAFAGSHSGQWQGQVSISSMYMVAKQPDASGSAMLLPAMVETYAILGLLISVLLVFKIAVI